MKERYCDVLVIGGGAAGARAAYEAKRAFPSEDVVLAVTGTYEGGGSTNIVASEALGINAPFNYMNDGDDPAIYLDDMLKTGGGLGDASLCAILANESEPRILELMAMGVDFVRCDGHPEQQKLSGCTKARSLTCGGSTGRQITGALKRALLQAGVSLHEQTQMLRLCQDDNGTVCGAYGRNMDGPVQYTAKAVVLATGGAGNIFETNVTPATQTGDGWAMAYEVGCRFVNMEFFQIGPAVAHASMKFIIHSHMWRFLPKLSNCAGEELLSRYCSEGVTPEEALADKAMSYPFSVRTNAKYVDIAVFKELMQGRGGPNGGVYFDVRHVGKDALLQRAPITYRTLLAAGIDCAVEPFELTMAVQNFNGGVCIDKNGWTGVEGLYAAGEVTGGVHGSDRPGGNNLTDTQVFGYRAGRSAAAHAATCGDVHPEADDTFLRTETTEDERLVMRESERLYYRNMTVVRTDEGLREVQEFVQRHFRSENSLPLRNRLLLGGIFAEALRNRTESRGTHYREDYPASSDAWLKRQIIRRGEDGAPTVQIS